MKNLIASLLAEYLLNSLWQLPLVYCAAALASRIAQPAGPGAQHRIWAGAIVVATMLPICHFRLQDLWHPAIAFLLGEAPDSPSSSDVRILFGPANGHPAGLHLAPWLANTILLLYAAILSYFAARLLWAVWRTAQIRRHAQPFPSAADVTARFQHLGSVFGFHAGRLAVSPGIHGPVTVGIRRPVLLVPSGFLEALSAEDRDTVLAHELAHMQRHDFARNLVFELLTLTLSFHPVLWLIRSRAAESREMVCDEMAAAAVAGKDRYARSLLRLASMLSIRMPDRNLHAIGIFDANHFERRVMNLTRTRLALRHNQRLLIAAACTALALATCASAIALRMNVSSEQSPGEVPKTIHVNSDSLKLISKVNPVYPIDAKKAKIQGTVQLEALIGKDGVPMRLKVQEGPKELQQSALDAVRQWRYEPYLLNGNPTEVETTIIVIYELAK